MKNVHLLPTEKPIKSVGDLVKDKYGDIHIFTKNDGKEYGKTTTKLNIYIISDEEPKKGDWCYDRSVEGRLVRYTELPKHWVDTQKKIILTTDPNLIADGVQAIDDKFLEWFVKNPTCEFVEVEKRYSDFTVDPFVGYKIIIPQEESKQEGYICPHTKIQCDDECCVSAENCHITSSLASGMVDCDEPKQETLEEAALKWVFETNGHKWSNNDNTTGDNYGSFKAGANWQAKRMYSEEEFRLFARQYYREIKLDKSNLLWDDLADKCLEQFKKK